MQRTTRWLLPALLVLAWLAISAVGGPYFGRLSEVQLQSSTDFLPLSAESTQVTRIQLAANEDANPPAILVYQSDGGIDAATRELLDAQLGQITALPSVSQASPLLPATRGSDTTPAYQAFVVLEGDASEAVADIRAITAETPAGVNAYVTGPAGIVADLVVAFGNIDGILLIVAVVAVFVILLLVYRSLVLPFIVLLSSVGALAGSVVAVYFMARAGWIVLNAQAQGILFILVIGAATDYALLLVARYREALQEHESPRKALLVAWRATVEPVAASGGTVIAGLLCLLFSDLFSNKALGPVAAAGIVFAMLSALTFLPGMLALLGRGVFYPNLPRVGTARTDGAGFWSRVSGLVAARPRQVWVGTLAVLLVAAAFTPLFRADGVSQSEFVLGEAEGRSGQQVRSEYFPAGAGTPAVIMATPELAGAVLAAAAAVEGVESVAPASGAGVPAAGEPAILEAEGRQWLELAATLAYSPDSAEALAAITALRKAVKQADPEALVGGTTAADLDTRTTASRDLLVIIPIVLAVVTLLLILLLRSLVAPLILISTTVISYLSTLGISALVFNYAFGFPGADAAVPLFAFVFLVALGIDYNIFLTSRIREEALQIGTRPGILKGLRVTGGVITSAGVVLAATFAALAVIPILFLVQLAFIVALGVLIDTFVVRSLLVPGLLYDIGPRIWWPSRQAGRQAAAGRAQAATAALETRGTPD